MAANKKAIKERIRSIRSTKKITSAMEVIANAKLAKQRSVMEKNRAYSDIIQDTIASIMASDIEIDSAFLNAKSSSNTYYLIFGSDLGLCGAYNMNAIKELDDIYEDGDKVIVFGTKIAPLLKKDGIDIVMSKPSDTVRYEDIQKAMKMMVRAYLNDEVGKIKVIYTRFNNAVSFIPSVKQILPYEKKEGKQIDLIFDPDVKTVLDELIRMSTESVAYSLYLETKISEQASRRMAMQNANDNADELEQELVLAYNQARQAAITQEITEIIAGADAL